MTTSVVLADTPALLDSCLKDISANGVTKVAVDLEGVELCRLGKLSIIQLFANGSNTVWLVDVTVLGSLAFSHVDPQGRSLKSVLESERVQKLFYDVRNDADALYNLYQINLVNVCDLQLLEVAVRRSAHLKVRLLSGLAKTIETYISTQAQWQRIKEEGIALFRPEKGGSYEVFERRPLDPRIIAYSAQDVALLFRLEMVLSSRMGNFEKNWKRRVMQASASRVQEAHSPSYSGNGKHRATAPSFQQAFSLDSSRAQALIAKCT